MKNLLVLAMIVLITSCNGGDKQADAFGNFETIDVLVSSEVPGKIIDFSVIEGDQISENQILCYIDSTTYSIQKRKLTASQKAINAKQQQVVTSVDVLKTQLSVYNKELNRVTQMHKNGAATPKQIDDIRGQMDIVQMKIKNARTQLSAIEAEKDMLAAQIAEVNDLLKKCIIQSPQSGIILQKFAEKGEITAPGKPLLKVGDLTNMYLKAYVSGVQLAAIKIGQKVNVLFDKDKDNNQQIPGEITWISSRAEFTPKIIQTKEERVDQVYAIKVNIKNDGRVKIGMPGEVIF